MITLQAPASKSVSHRMVMGAALAQGDSVVSRVLESKDLERTMAILRAAGAGIVRVGEGEYAVSGVGGQPHGGAVDPVSCDVHESGIKPVRNSALTWRQTSSPSLSNGICLSYPPAIRMGFCRSA